MRNEEKHLIKARKLLEASETDSCQLLLEMKKIKGDKKARVDLPDSVGGESGESQIVEEFRKVYSALYNSSDTSEDMAKLKDILAREISISSIAEVDKITGQRVK